MSDSEQGTSPPPPPARSQVPTSCTKAFDRVYYCYSPVHQSRNYYREGVFDNCRDRMKTFRMCVMSRLRPQEESEKLYELEERKKQAKKGQPVWEIRPEFERATAEYDAKRSDDGGANGNDASGSDKWWK